jgi:hypothetical protein
MARGGEGRAMKIIWQTRPGPETDFEYQYIRRLVLDKIEAREVFDEAHYQEQGDSDIIIYSCNDKSIPQAFRHYLERAKNFVLIHLSLERLLHNADYYALARLVFRPYFDPRLRDQNVYFLPLGFQSGFLSSDDHAPPEQRKYVWCFAGQLKSHRRRMINKLQNIQPHYLHITKQWADPLAMSAADMQRIYQQTLFVPCPFGNRNPDSYRIMEALENGCIPVVLTFFGEDYFRFVFGDHPFIVAKNWSDASRQISALLSNPSALSQRHAKLIQWYKNFKTDLADDIHHLIVTGCDRAQLRSMQFIYQRETPKFWRLQLYNLYYGHGLHRRLFRWFINL